MDLQMKNNTLSLSISALAFMYKGPVPMSQGPFTLYKAQRLPPRIKLAAKVSPSQKAGGNPTYLDKM